MSTIGASDLHLKADSPPIYRVDGKLRHTKASPMSAEKIESLVREWIGEHRMRDLETVGNVDIGHEFDGGRVRVAVFMQRGRITVVARLVKTEIPSLKELNLPASLARLIGYEQGLVLVCGITGMGKSTTLACLLEMMNQKLAKHVLTFEDPIEFVYQDKLSIINQREFGLDFGNWPDAIRAGVRADPDVMLVGEMRDDETCQHSLVACETGHLVFSTLHTSSAATSIGRILDLFPPERHRLIRHSLSINLQAVICQRLIPSFRPDFPRVPAMEIMFCNPSIRKSIDDGDDARIGDLILEGEAEGMQSWTKSYVDLVNSDFIERKIARQCAPQKEAMERALKGIDISTSTMK
jgi:twitching motility protein PilT